MLGAIAGEIISSGYNFSNERKYDFKLFPNNTKCGYVTIFSIALADSLMNNTSFETKFLDYSQLYPSGNFGGVFSGRAGSDLAHFTIPSIKTPLVISPISWFCESLEESLNKTEEYVSLFEHTEADLKGAKVISSIIYLAKNGADKNLIEEFVENYFGYILSENHLVKTSSQDREFDPLITKTLNMFLESESFEDCIRKAVLIDNDSSITIAAASIAEAFYSRIPQNFKNILLSKLDQNLQQVLLKFIRNYCFI